MKFLKTLLATGVVSTCLAAASASAQVVTIATGAQGSLAYNSGQAVAKVANEAGITARAQPLVGYLPLINNGEVDFGFGQNATAFFDQLKCQLFCLSIVLRRFVRCCQPDHFSTGLVGVVLRGEVFRRGENFAKFLASVSLQNDSITMLTFDFVDVAKDSHPAERSVTDEVSMNAVVAGR